VRFDGKASADSFVSVLLPAEPKLAAAIDGAHERSFATITVNSLEVLND
jgi:hypothetical protein